MKKVLIVEDEILARLGLRQLVDWRKLELELLPDATDGEEALKMIRNSCPDIIRFICREYVKSVMKRL